MEQPCSPLKRVHQPRDPLAAPPRAGSTTSSKSGRPRISRRPQRVGQVDDDPGLAAPRRLRGYGTGAVNLPLQATVLIPGLVRQQVLLARCRAGGHQAGCAGVPAPALCHGEAEVRRRQGLQHWGVLLRILMLERNRRTRHDEALAERACHHRRRNQRSEVLARSGAGLDHRDVFAPAATTSIRLLTTAGQRVRDSGDHLELRTPRPEPCNAIPPRVRAVPDEILFGVGQHRSRLRVNPARPSHRVALLRLVLRGLTTPHGVGQGRNDVNDKGIGPTTDNRAHGPLRLPQQRSTGRQGPVGVQDAALVGLTALPASGAGYNLGVGAQARSLVGRSWRIFGRPTGSLRCARIGGTLRVTHRDLGLLIDHLAYLVAH